MRKLKIALRCIVHKPSELIAYAFMKCFAFLPDALFLRGLFILKMGERLNLKVPKTYNQKLQWLKLNDRIPSHCNMVEKYEAKLLAEKIIDKKYIIPTFGVWDHYEDIDFSKLPDQFVLKATHGCGNRDVIICKDKTTFDFAKAKKKIEYSLRHNEVYKNQREWPYKNLKRRIIAEQYLSDDNVAFLQDYKFYCFNGEPQIVAVSNDRNSVSVTCFDYYDMSFIHLPFTWGGPNYPNLIKKPKAFEEMIEVARKLSHGLIHVRIDLYNINGSIYFGEWTFYDSSGFEKFHPKEWDYKFGDMIKLPIQKK